MKIPFFKRKKRKIGLVLGSGAARGLAHIGVLTALREENIAIDMIAGSSMGALTGAYFAAHRDIEGLEKTVLNMGFKDYLELVDPQFHLLLKGFISGNKITEFLKRIIGDIEFKDLPIPLIVTATDIETGEAVIIKNGSVVEAIRASISIPAIFTPVKVNGKFLVDGGIVNPVPVNVLRNAGMDFIIASNTIKKPKVRARVNKKEIFNAEDKNPIFKKISDEIAKFIQPDKNLPANEKGVIDGTPSIFETVIGAIYTMEYQIAKAQTKAADLAINPAIDYIAPLEFYRAKEAIAAGYKETQKILSKINLKKILSPPETEALSKI